MVIFTRNSLYPEYHRSFRMCDCENNAFVRLLVYLGKKVVVDLSGASVGDCGAIDASN
jgi:hypothetical protein